MTPWVGRRGDATEQAKVIACDALMHAACAERESGFSDASTWEDRRLNRLRLLLNLGATLNEILTGRPRFHCDRLYKRHRK